MMLSDAEIEEMVAIGRGRDVEVCLFLGPRGGWDAGGQALVTGAAAGVARGAEAVEACVAEADRACALGVRSLLVGDVGVLDVLGRLRASGSLPGDLIFKTSAVMVAANPATAALFDRLGADTINVGTDLTIGMLAAIRGVTEKPIDIYVEVPDDLGGFVRTYEVPGHRSGGGPRAPQVRSAKRLRGLPERWAPGGCRSGPGTGEGPARRAGGATAAPAGPGARIATPAAASSPGRRSDTGRRSPAPAARRPS